MRSAHITLNLFHNFRVVSSKEIKNVLSDDDTDLTVAAT